MVLAAAAVVAVVASEEDRMAHRWESIRKRIYPAVGSAFYKSSFDIIKNIVETALCFSSLSATVEYGPTMLHIWIFIVDFMFQSTFTPFIHIIAIQAQAY